MRFSTRIQDKLIERGVHIEIVDGFVNEEYDIEMDREQIKLYMKATGKTIEEVDREVVDLAQIYLYGRTYTEAEVATHNEKLGGAY